MKDTEAWAATGDGCPLLRTVAWSECAARRHAHFHYEDNEISTIEPVVIVSKARYEALETCERIVHGRAIAMCEERGAEGETSLAEEAVT